MPFGRLKDLFSTLRFRLLIWVTGVDPKKPRNFIWHSEPAEFRSGELCRASTTRRGIHDG